jgi:hypothetical protein
MGRWVAYTSNEAVRDEVYVQSFPMPGNKLQVSVGGEDSPRWRGNRKEIYYLAPDRALMAVPVTDQLAQQARKDHRPSQAAFAGRRSRGWSLLYYFRYA